MGKPPLGVELGDAMESDTPVLPDADDEELVEEVEKEE